jgi:transposase
MLHICVLSSILDPTELRDYFKKKTKEEGKSKMAVINAVRYELILRIFAYLNQDWLYQNNYKRALSSIEYTNR